MCVCENYSESVCFYLKFIFLIKRVREDKKTPRSKLIEILCFACKIILLMIYQKGSFSIYIYIVKNVWVRREQKNIPLQNLN